MESMERVKLSYFNNNYRLIRNRELGFRPSLGHGDDIARKIYGNFEASYPDILQRYLQRYTTQNGGIYNLDFNFDGSVLLAACERKAILIYDAWNQHNINELKEAHCKSVNCVKFLSENTFASSSDDCSIKIWDTRCLKNCTRAVYEDLSYIKNIEYSEKEKVMVTSGFNGTIHSWDGTLNHDRVIDSSKVFGMAGLVRMKLTPDGSKMILTTTSGYIIVIHDLDLGTLLSDMKGFKPHLYRLMQSSQQAFPNTTMYNHLLDQNRKRNRVEFISDFPNAAELISSLQIHPMGWSALSRNVGRDDVEWTCVHDIQKREPKDYEDAYFYCEELDLQEFDSPGEFDSEDEESEGEDPNDIWMGFMTNSQYQAHQNFFFVSDEETDDDHSYPIAINSGLLDPNFNECIKQPVERYKVFKNLPRLTHYKEESNVGKGYIKELCFSKDGRLVCSPYDKGVRLLGFNQDLQEMNHCLRDEPKELFTLSTMNNYHPDVVVCCKFNPRHYQMVSGCVGGELVWYKPVL